jgi:type II secretory pathway pseudopilin PulG
MYTHRQRRPAITLVELLVVIAIILIITAIGVMAIPSAADRNMQSGADQLQGWLLICKQRAKRDGVPTGLRIQFDANGNATQLNYVQQPIDVSGGTCTGVGNNTVTFTGFNPLTANVSPGDYLEVYRGGGVYQITAVTATSVTIATTGPNLQSAISNPAGTTTEYRIRRQPVPLSGENTLQLPDGVTVLLSKSLNIPSRTVLGTTYYEIMFSPQGGLVGRGSGTDQICVMWLINTNNTTIPALLVAIQTHTGFIGVQPDASAVSTDPYKFCRDGRASGL